MTERIGDEALAPAFNQMRLASEAVDVKEEHVRARGHLAHNQAATEATTMQQCYGCPYARYTQPPLGKRDPCANQAVKLIVWKSAWKARASDHSPLGPTGQLGAIAIWMQRVRAHNRATCARMILRAFTWSLPASVHMQ